MTTSTYQRRHFEDVARIILENKQFIESTLRHARESDNQKINLRLTTLAVLAQDFANFFSTQNTGFDRDKFLDACGFDYLNW